MVELLIVDKVKVKAGLIGIIIGSLRLFLRLNTLKTER